MNTIALSICNPFAFQCIILCAGQGYVIAGWFHSVAVIALHRYRRFDRAHNFTCARRVRQRWIIRAIHLVGCVREEKLEAQLDRAFHKICEPTLKKQICIARIL